MVDGLHVIDSTLQTFCDGEHQNDADTGKEHMQGADNSIDEEVGFLSLKHFFMH